MYCLYGLLLSFLVLAVVNGSEEGGDGHDIRGHSLVKRKIGEAQWNQWSIWGTCSKSCGEKGTQTRTRTCRALVESQSCSGLDKEKQSCNQQVCPGQWTEWSQWSTIWSLVHGRWFNDEQSRTRTCSGGACSGLRRERRQYQRSPLIDSNQWSACSVTCGNDGQQTRTRVCIGDGDCPNPNSTVNEKRPCLPQPPRCTKWTELERLVWAKCLRKCGNRFPNPNCTRDDFVDCLIDLTWT